MIFSVITPAFNCANYIMTNIQSVRNQGFTADELEHWIIDGKSTDGTVDILKGQKHIHWISEEDSGLSEAVNKGIRRAKGDWIIWLNADDYLLPDTLIFFLEFVRKHPSGRIFCGDQQIVNYDNEPEQIIQGWAYNVEDLLGLRTGTVQDSTFVHREVYEKVGFLDESNRYTMDYEWFVRAAFHYECIHVPKVLTCYRRRKDSITDQEGTYHQFKDFLAIRRKYNRSKFCLAEYRIRFYLYTQPLRRILWLRRTIRFMKALFGQRPLHP